MSTAEQRESSLRERQQMATREEILDRATDLLLAGEELVSHELIARAAGMSARTVYRKALMSALWTRLRAITRVQFPTREEDIVPFAREAFASLDDHARLVNAVMASVAGAHLQRLPAQEGSAAFAKALEPLTARLSQAEQKRIMASFLAIYSATFWQLLHERGGLTGPEAQDATAWILETLLGSLRKNAPPTKPKKGTRK